MWIIIYKFIVHNSGHLPVTPRTLNLNSSNRFRPQPWSQRLGLLQIDKEAHFYVLLPLGLRGSTAGLASPYLSCLVILENGCYPKGCVLYMEIMMNSFIIFERLYLFLLDWSFPAINNPPGRWWQFILTNNSQLMVREFGFFFPILIKAGKLGI